MPTNATLFRKASSAWERRDLRRALDLFHSAAKAGDRASQVNLGYFYDCGLGVKQDSAQALRWYHKAYLQGDAGAANNIATIYRDAGNQKRMLWWLKKAAHMGDLDVLLQLGRSYHKGDGVRQDYHRAAVYYSMVLKSRNATKEDRVLAAGALRLLENKIGGKKSWRRRHVTTNT